MSLYLRLESGAGGTPLEAIEKACQVAKATTIMVRFELNGVDVLVAPEDSPAFMHGQWLDAVKNKRTFVSALTI